MFKNYLKIALRNLLKHKGYSFINITGLAIGMACCILIMMWVRDELSFDSFHKNAHEIYRVVFEDVTYEQTRHYRVTPPALAPALKNDFPEVLHSLRFESQEGMLVKYGEKSFKETVVFTDASIFEIFTLPFVKGSATTAFANPFSVVISEEMAAKYFPKPGTSIGYEDPINQNLRIDNRFDFTVSGIIKDVPGNSSFNFDFLVPFEHFEAFSGYGNIESWDHFGFNTFVLLPREVNIAGFNRKISDYLIKTVPLDFQPELYLQPLTHIHLYDLNGGGVITYVYIFSLIAIFVLLIACINFMNLSTARSATRSKEVGLRKVAGAGKMSLIRQFVGESILLSFIAFFFALGFVELFLPAFNNLAGKSLSLKIMGNFPLLLLLIGITLLTGVVSGSYPALLLSSLKPVKVLKGGIRSGASPLRKILVVFQFSLSIILIICTIVVFKQADYISSKDLGFDKDHVVYIPLNQNLSEKYQSVKNELLQRTDILNAAATSSKIGIRQKSSFDITSWDGNDGGQRILLNRIDAGNDFLETFNMEMVSGRYFSEDFAADSAGVVLNETAVREMGLTDPIGKRIADRFTIIGVIKDFNFRSLHSGIEPLALFRNPGGYSYLAVKIKAGNISGTIQYLEEVTKKFAPDFPFEYHFLDEDFEKMYRSEIRMGGVFFYFAMLAILISCLGLFALAAFAAEQRTKEIGIRKVLGASVSGLLILLSKEFTKWVILANVIAWPIAYVAMNNWLQNFAYRINIGIWTFVLAGALALVIALLTVSYQAIKAAIANPVEALRYE